MAAILKPSAMATFLGPANNFYIFKTDTVPTFGVTFSQIGTIRLCPVQEEGINVRIPRSKLFSNVVEYIENASQSERVPEAPDRNLEAFDKLCED